MANQVESTRYKLGARTVGRIGYGAMQLAGPNAFGPPTDRKAAVAVLREAIERGVDHIDTSDIYGPHTTNEVIREALHPYRDGVLIATKVGAVRGPGGSWEAAFSASDIEQAVHDNLRNLALDVLELVNLRVMFSAMGPAEGSIAAPLAALAALQRRGLVRHIGLSNVTRAQIEEARGIVEIVCVQNHFNVAHRRDDAIVDELASRGVAYVPFFPLGGFSPVQSALLDAVAARRGATPKQVALAWLLRRSPNTLLIPGTKTLAHLRENLASASVELSDDDLRALGRIARG